MEIAGRLRFSPFSTQIYRGVAKYGGRSLPTPSSSYKWKISQIPLAHRLRCPTTRRLHAGLISITKRITPYAVVLSESVVVHQLKQAFDFSRNRFSSILCICVYISSTSILDINNRPISLSRLLFRYCVYMVE